MLKIFEGSKANTIRRGGSALVLVSGLGLAACGSSSPESNTTTTTAPAPSTTIPPARAQVKFDALGAYPSVIQVYQGYGESAYDKTADGTYYGYLKIGRQVIAQGDTVGAICQTEGREVHSAPGEHPVTSSDTWVEIDSGVAGEKQYATSVYLEPSPAISQLPIC